MNTHIKDGHEYMRAFRSKTLIENQKCIQQDKGFYYYMDYDNWENYTRLHIGDVVLFNNRFNCSNPIGLGVLGVITDKELFFNENGTWHQVKDKYMPFTEYSENGVEICYKFITANGDLNPFATSHSINNFATLDNVQSYFAELLKRKKEMQFYDTKVKEAEQARDTYCKSLEDFKIDGSYDMLYEKPYEGDK